jgi:hypothetical protein
MADTTVARLWNLCETGNSKEIEIAMSEPGVIFWKPIGDYTDSFVRAMP